MGIRLAPSHIYPLISPDLSAIDLSNMPNIHAAPDGDVYAVRL